MRIRLRNRLPHITVASTLPGGVADLVVAALACTPVDPGGVAIRVKRHGVRRVFYRACRRASCELVHNAPPGWEEGPAAGPGHLYARRRDLQACRGGHAVVALDRTTHWVTGRAYDGVPYPSAVPSWISHVVTLKVPSVIPAGHLPADRTYHRAKRAGATRIETPADDLVFVLAHEMAHIAQFREDLPRSEVQAEIAGREGLRRWVAEGRPEGHRLG